MQALQKLTANALFSRTSSLVNLQSATPAGSMSLTAIRGFADIKKTAKEDTNWVTDGVKATVGHASKKAKEALGYQKSPGDESQEPAGVMENRDANEDKQPQSRYSEVASKGKESFQENNATNLYQNANKSANAAADRGKDKAQDKARKDS